MTTLEAPSDPSSADPGDADHSFPKRLAIAAAAVVVVVGLVMATAAETEPFPVSGRNVLLVGDSLLANSRDAVEQTLVAEGWDPTIGAVPGSTIDIWQARLAPVAARARPNVAVVELGTNDCFEGRCDLAPQIDRIVAEVSKTADVVLWLTVQATPTHPVPYDHVNEQIRLAAARHPDMRIVEFGALFDEHPEWHIADGLHPNEAGQRAMADLIAAELRPYEPRR
jgi:lysophospholipase L1-like esterase